jgi:hypothetical protein
MDQMERTPPVCSSLSIMPNVWGSQGQSKVEDEKAGATRAEAESLEAFEENQALTDKRLAKETVELVLNTHPHISLAYMLMPLGGMLLSIGLVALGTATMVQHDIIKVRDKHL